MFASSPPEVTQGSSPQFRAKRLSLHFFRPKRPTDFKCPAEKIQIQSGYFVYDILLALNEARTGNARHKVSPSLMADMGNSVCDHGANINEKMSLKGLRRTCHSADSPDISLRDFWAFGRIEEMINDRHFRGFEEILRAIQKGWSHFILEDFQNVFKSWMERLTCVIANNGDCCH
jgi:hypothetical protein